MTRSVDRNGPSNSGYDEKPSGSVPYRRSAAEGKPKREMTAAEFQAKVITERDVCRQVRDFFRARGWRVLRMNVQASVNAAGGWVQSGEKGMPDFLCLRYGVSKGLAAICWVEVKSPRGKVRDQQRLWHQAEQHLGAVVMVVDSIESLHTQYEQNFPLSGDAHQARFALVEDF